MKKFFLIFTALTLMFGSACQIIPEVLFLKKKDDRSTFLSSDLRRDMDPDVSALQLEQLVWDISSFALAFYNLARQNNDNLVFSPFSLSLGLSMTLSGAESSTEQAMLEALQFSLDEDEIHPAFNSLLLAIDVSKAIGDSAKRGKFQLNIANSIWVQDGFELEQQFLDTLAVNYGTGIYNVDFITGPESARLAINDWVKKETENKFQNLIPPDTISPLTRVVSVNALYFYDAWKYPFDKKATSPGPFILLDGTEIPVDMMKLYDQELLYIEGADFQAVRLPYRTGDFAMTLIVPDKGSFEAIQASLAKSFINELSEAMGTERLNLEMPKFDFETTINASDFLITLGMAAAFDPYLSDFKGIADVEDFHITDVYQKATITVDEEGTEATSASYFFGPVTSQYGVNPITLVIDRPFFFLIEHLPTGTILFMGHVAKP